MQLSDPSYNHYQKYELQVVLEDLANGNIAIDSQQPTASNPQQQQCECTNTSATVPTHRTSSPMKFARLRRRRRSYGYLMGNANPQPPVKWQCSCMPNMTLRVGVAKRVSCFLLWYIVWCAKFIDAIPHSIFMNLCNIPHFLQK